MNNLAVALDTEDVPSLVVHGLTATNTPVYIHRPVRSVRTDTKRTVEIVKAEAEEDWPVTTAWKGKISRALRQKREMDLPSFTTVDALIAYLNRERG